MHAIERIATRPLRCHELPRRLVKNLRGRGGGEDDLTGAALSEEQDEGSLELELLEYLLDKYKASPNSKGGYFLARAVFARHKNLVDLLLRYGADPGVKSGWAVVAAIGYGDINLVKTLMERNTDRPVEIREEGDGEDFRVLLKNGRKKRRTSNGGGGGKRRKMEKRCEPSKEMLEAAVKRQHWNIVEYLISRGTSDFLLWLNSYSPLVLNESDGPDLYTF